MLLPVAKHSNTRVYGAIPIKPQHGFHLAFNLLFRLKGRQEQEEAERIYYTLLGVPRFLSGAQRLEGRDAQGFSNLKCPGERDVEDKGIHYWVMSLPQAPALSHPWRKEIQWLEAA